MKLITQQLAKALPSMHRLLAEKQTNPLDILDTKNIIQRVNKLEIYDRTTTTKRSDLEIIGIKDHINRTGINPLRGLQKKLGIDFIDITRLYKSENNIIITNCCGKMLNKKHAYPSHYLCNISILAKALGIQEISAFLVNII